MNGLVWKDIVMLRTGIAYISVFAVVFSLLFSENNLMCIVSSILFASLVSSSFAWDDQCQWNVFAVSAGLDRSLIVRSKFVSAVVFILIGTAIGFAVTCAISVYHGSLDVMSVAGTSALGFTIGTVVSFISIAVNYVTGNSAKAQYVSIVVLMGSIAFLVAGTMILSDVLGGGIGVITCAMSLILVAILAASYRVSCARFSGRDI